MNILYLLHNRVGKGTYFRALNLARCLTHTGNSVTLVTISQANIFRFECHDIDGVNVIESPDLLPGMMRSGWDMWDVYQRILKLRNTDFDIIHAFECRPVTIYPAMYIHRKQKIPLVTDWSDWFGKGGSVEERQNPLLRLVLRPVETYYERHFRPRTQGTTTINDVLRKMAIEMGLKPEFILLLPNGCDHEHIVPGFKEAARHQLNIPDNVPVIGYIGSIFRTDARLMAESFSKIKNTGQNHILLMAGYFDTDFIEMTGHPDSVFNLGPVPFHKISQILSACDVCWLVLSDTGANQGRWPTKLGDYMAAGRPVVTTNVGGLGNFVDHHKIGFVAEDNPEDISEKTIKLLSDSIVYEEMGNRARHLAETTYSWETISQKLEKFYRLIIQGQYIIDEQFIES